MLRVIVVGFVLAVVGRAHASTFSVEVTGPAWQADALAVALRNDLAVKDFVLADPAGGAEVAVRVAFAGTAITYVVSRDGMPPVRGAHALGELDRRAFANAIVDGMHRLASTKQVQEEPAATSSLVLLLAGGLAWGALIALCLPLVFPPLVGLHRAEHRELFPVMGAWLSVAMQRVVWVAIVSAPLVAGVWLVQPMFGVALAWGVVLPIAAIALRVVWIGVRRLVARRLDRELVDGVASVHNPWHAQVRAYLRGYLARANLDVDETLVDRMRFYPGREDEAIHAYAGRVVIGRAILERALAPYGRPHDFEMPRVSTLHWTHWNSGLVMATESDQKLATREDRDPSKHATVEEGVHERIALGEPPTFTGVVEPVALDPRTHYRPEDDPSWLDWDPGEEFDGTDAGDKDFLFGALVLAMGAVQRHEDATVSLWLRRLSTRSAVARVIAAVGNIVDAVVGPLRRFFAAQTAALADVHATLAGARHHVAQYHAWRLWRRDDLLTSRAYVPELEATSRAIGRALDREDAQRRDARGERGGRGAERLDVHRRDPEAMMLRRRIAQLRAFTEPLRAHGRVRRRVFVAFAMFAGIALVAVLAVQAVLYRATYEERIDEQREQQRDQLDQRPEQLDEQRSSTRRHP
jgi:hypothetical protein